MYETRHAGRTRPPQDAIRICRTLLLAGLVVANLAPQSWAEGIVIDEARYNPSIIRKISGDSERLEMTTNTSRILTLDKKIPRVQVNNPELLVVTPLSDKQVQVSAKRPGVTQINLWDEEGNIHAVDVLVYGDASELEHALQVQFPHSSIKVYRYSDSLVLKGFVDQPDYVSQIVRLAEDYAPKVINNITVGGVQQVLLKVQVMEVSRTKLRRLGVDFAQVSSSGGFVGSSVSGLISSIAQNTNGQLQVTTNGSQTFEFGVVDGGDAFFGFLDALQRNNIAKILAEPNLVAVSGRPAQFNVGGEIPILVPQSLGTASIEFKKFGTQVDFLPIVLGNGNIRLEVRPRISEIDPSRSVVIQNFTIPALTVREVDTAVEMKAGQTFALAGLIQERVEGQMSGLPWVSDIPVIGIPFRRVEETVNEIELLIMVTPEFVDAISPGEVPCGRPGMDTVSPTDAGLYCGGHLEVPAYCNPISGLQSCGDGGCYCGGSDYVISTDGEYSMPGGTGYDEGTYYEPTPAGPMIEGPSMHGELSMPPSEGGGEDLPPGDAAGGSKSSGPEFSVLSAGGGSNSAAPRAYSPPRSPVYLRNAARPQNPQAGAAESTPVDVESLPDLIGPVGYDVQ